MLHSITQCYNNQIFPQDSNLVTLKNSKASATLQNDGSILCNHEDLCSVRKYVLGGCTCIDLLIMSLSISSA